MSNVKGVVQSREYEQRRRITRTDSDSQTSELVECQGYTPSQGRVSNYSLFGIIHVTRCRTIQWEASLSVKSKYLLPYFGADHWKFENNIRSLYDYNYWVYKYELSSSTILL